MTETRRPLRRGELYAIDQHAILSDASSPGAFFWLFGPPVFKNERIGSVCVVRISGPLEYHDDGCGDSYEAIVKRVQCGISGDTDGDNDEDDWEGPPSAVVLRIDSPGGVVAGLHETVKKLRTMSQTSGIPLYAYVDETAYSASYAIACACKEIYLPRSGFCGSIGVISTLADQTAADAKAGLRIVVVTSGARKADGHPHVPITDAMIAEEQPRVDTLAMQFFKDVRLATGLSIDTIQSFQAGRFLGVEAVTAGVATGVMGWDELVQTLNDKAQAQQDSQVAPLRQVVPPSAAKVEDMTLSLDAMIARTRASLKTEKDPAKAAALRADLSAYKKTKTHIEKHETEEGEDGADEEEEESEKGDETEREEESDESPPADDDKDDDSDSKDKDDEDDEDDADDEDEAAEEEEAAAKSAVAAVLTAAASVGITKVPARKAIRRAVVAAVTKAVNSSRAARVYAEVRALTGKRSVSGIGAVLRGQAIALKDSKAQLVIAQKDARRSKRDAMISQALQAHRITPAQARDLRTKKLALVEQVLSMHTSTLVNADPNDAPVPGMAPGAIPAALQSQIDGMMTALKQRGIDLSDQRATIEKDVAAKSNPNGRVI